MNRNKLYLILFIACLAGYIWLYYASLPGLAGNKSPEVCLLKHVTDMPCPSCGSTRSVVSLLNGRYGDAFLLNPLGYVIALIMLIAPVWMAVDIARRSNSLFKFYQKIEVGLRKPKYAILLILLIMINWIWNITKGL